MPGPVGEYQIVRHWASGDTSQIYLARRRQSTSLVALKTLRADRAHDREHERWFAHEVSLAQRADHENVVQALETFEHEGEQFLAMEFLRGETLHDIARALHPGRRMPAALAIELAQRLARGLHHLHQLGAIHGDVCPANVVIAYDGRAKLLDLGGRCLGCNAYLSPEQARGEAIDARADTFSLGLILFELLTGHRVRRGGSDTEIAASAISGSVPRLSDLVEADPELDELLMTATAHDRKARFKDAGAFADALLAYRERVVPDLTFEAKMADFMEHHFAGRARSFSAQLSGDRPRPKADPWPLIEAALRTHTRSSNPFAEPITSDVGWSGERTGSGELAPLPRRPSWPVVAGLSLIVLALIVAAFFLGDWLAKT